VRRAGRMTAARQMTWQGGAREPVLRVLADGAAAQIREPIGMTRADRGRLEAIEREVGAVGRDIDQPLPDRGGFPLVAFGDAYVSEVQIRGHRARVEIDRRLEPAHRFLVLLAPHVLEADLVL